MQNKTSRVAHGAPCVSPSLRPGPSRDRATHRLGRPSPDHTGGGLSADGERAIVEALALRTAVLAVRDATLPEEVALTIDDVATAIAFATPGATAEDYLTLVDQRHGAVLGVGG
ncbi:hypothetical protein [Patulibacter defluvii]|uniref:hypothetical protein n=1 Tax=Patulibacter defluvii TaxID=3095358 RepID=UPI002A75F01D|nr:hypothetical protein [Patulibacter sp. DM4]